MAKTKKKIFTAALKLFNESGLQNVRLQHIADEAFISVGNLAYHYKNKEAIVQAIYEEITQKQKSLLSEYRIVPLFDNLNRLFQGTFLLQQQYIFFYLDTLEILRTYPEIGKAHQSHIQSKVSQMKIMLDFNSARGALIIEPQEGTYEQLAQLLWMMMDLWHSQQAISGNDITPTETAYSGMIWQLLIPYFSATGKQEYAQMREKPYDFFF